MISPVVRARRSMTPSSVPFSSVPLQADMSKSRSVNHSVSLESATPLIPCVPAGSFKGNDGPRKRRSLTLSTRSWVSQSTRTESRSSSRCTDQLFQDLAPVSVTLPPAQRSVKSGEFQRAGNANSVWLQIPVRPRSVASPLHASQECSAVEQTKAWRPSCRKHFAAACQHCPVCLSSLADWHREFSGRGTRTTSHMASMTSRSVASGENPDKAVPIGIVNDALWKYAVSNARKSLSLAYQEDVAELTPSELSAPLSAWVQRQSLKANAKDSHGTPADLQCVPLDSSVSSAHSDNAFDNAFDNGLEQRKPKHIGSEPEETTSQSDGALIQVDHDKAEDNSAKNDAAIKIQSQLRRKAAKRHTDVLHKKRADRKKKGAEPNSAKNAVAMKSQSQHGPTTAERQKDAVRKDATEKNAKKDAAATKIQSQKAAKKQVDASRKDAEAEYEEKVAAATRIQSQLRQKAAKRQVDALRKDAEEEYDAKSGAATKIQSHHRRKAAQRTVDEMRDLRVIEQVATEFLDLAPLEDFCANYLPHDSGIVALRMVDESQRAVLRATAATTIQSHVRRQAAERIVDGKRKAAVEDAAATVIQTSYRRNAADKKVNAMRKTRAAVRIQSCHRGKMARKIVNDLRKVDSVLSESLVCMCLGEALYELQRASPDFESEQEIVLSDSFVNLILLEETKLHVAEEIEQYIQPELEGTKCTQSEFKEGASDYASAEIERETVAGALSESKGGASDGSGAELHGTAHEGTPHGHICGESFGIYGRGAHSNALYHAVHTKETNEGLEKKLHIEHHEHGSNHEKRAGLVAEGVSTNCSVETEKPMPAVTQSGSQQQGPAIVEESSAPLNEKNLQPLAESQTHTSSSTLLHAAAVDEESTAEQPVLADSKSLSRLSDHRSSIITGECPVCFSMEERVLLKKYFELYDIDETGTLDQSELQLVIDDMDKVPEPGSEDERTLNRLFKKAFENSLGGELDFSEFESLMEWYYHSVYLRVFHSHDADNSGTVSKLELVDVTKELTKAGFMANPVEAQILFGVTDEDGDGVLSFSEFCDLMKAYRALEYHHLEAQAGFTDTMFESLQSLFENADVDNSGALDIKETASLLSKMSIGKSLDDPEALGEFVHLFSRVDRDTSATLDLQEFLRLMRVWKKKSNRPPVEVEVEEAWDVDIPIMSGAEGADEASPQNGRRSSASESASRGANRESYSRAHSDKIADNAENRVLAIQHGLSIEELEALRENFVFSDTDASGSISDPELPGLLKHCGCEPVTQIQKTVLKRCLDKLHRTEEVLGFTELIRLLVEYHDGCLSAIKERYGLTTDERETQPYRKRSGSDEIDMFAVDQLIVIFYQVGQYMSQQNVDQLLCDVGVEPGTPSISEDAFKKMLENRRLQRLSEWRKTYGFKDGELKRFKAAFEEFRDSIKLSIALDLVPDVVKELGYGSSDGENGTLELFMVTMTEDENEDQKYGSKDGVRGVQIPWQRFLQLLRHLETQRLKETVIQEQNVAKMLKMEEHEYKLIRKIFHTYDDHGTGVVSKNNIKSLFSQVGAAKTQEQRKVLRKALEHSDGEGLNFKQFLGILHMLDTSGHY